MKKWAIGLLLIVLTVFSVSCVLSACSNSGGSEKPSSSEEEKIEEYLDLHDPSLTYDENIDNFGFDFDQPTNGYMFTNYRGDADFVKIPSEFDDGINGKLPVTVIDEKVFAGNKDVKGFIIPGSVKIISPYAFKDLEELTVVEVPDSVEKIGGGAFTGCWNIGKITLPFVGESDSCAYSNSFFGFVFSDRNYEDSRGAEYDDEVDRFTYENEQYVPGKLTDVIISGGTRIEDFAFSCIRSVKRYILPETLLSIGKNSFFWNEGIKRIDVPTSVNSIGESAFNGCSHLVHMTLPFVGRSFEDSTYGNIGYVFGADSYKDNSRYMPSTLRTVTLTKQVSLAPGAFYGLDKLERVDLPDTIENIADSVFDGCTSLKYTESEGVYYLGNATNPHMIAMDADENRQTIAVSQNCISIHKRAFAECYKLESIVIPDSVKVIGEKAFYRARKLKTVTLPSSVTDIGDGAFYDAEGLESVVIADGSSLTRIGKYAFYNCTSLKEINLTSGLASIDYCAFLNTPNLKTVRIENLSMFMFCKIDNLSASPFMNAESLYVGGELTRKVAVPSSITRINDYQFAGLKAVDELSFAATNINVGNWAFYGMTENQKVTFMSAQANAYLSDEWNYGTNAVIAFAE